jgi:pyruvate dehydrogenase E2 component (dihydrolipoamide acetyltransferase)
MIKAIKVPEIGENVESGVVVAVHIKAGDTVAVDDTVIELETDKALVEIPSPFDGTVTEVLAEAGKQMKVGDVIASVETESKGSSKGASSTETDDDDTTAESEADAAASDREETPEAKSASPEPRETGADEKAQAPSKDHGRPASTDSKKDSDRRPAPAAPSIRRLARELGVDIHDIRGTGSGGRISEADVKSHVRDRLSQPSRSAGAAPSQTPDLPDFSRWGPIDTEEMATVRRLTAQNTATSWALIPHVTQFDEANVTDVMAFIEKKAKKAQKAGAKLTITAILVRLCALALKRFPQFNASIDTDNRQIIYKKYIHIGIAADTPRGLLVPVIRDADRMTIVDLAKAVAELAQRARDKKSKPDELEGGTFTISNQGGIGGVGFTPIVLWPQVAILGVSRSADRPIYVGDCFEARTILPLSLSYDHRIIDGADAARFLRWICDGLEQPLNMFLD